MGSFTLHKNSAKPAVFLAGGIGITPFSSIVRQADHDRASHKLYLFYSNRRPEDAPCVEATQAGLWSNAARRAAWKAGGHRAAKAFQALC
jgi:ferredoxin-NADP reductase